MPEHAWSVPVRAWWLVGAGLLITPGAVSNALSGSGAFRLMSLLQTAAAAALIAVGLLQRIDVTDIGVRVFPLGRLVPWSEIQQVVADPSPLGSMVRARRRDRPRPSVLTNPMTKARASTLAERLEAERASRST